MELRAPPAQDISANAFGIGKAQAVASVMIGIVLGLVVGGLGARMMAHEMPKRDAERDRSVASQLMAAGAGTQAAAMYERYLDNTQLDPKARAGIELSLGTTYLDAGHYDAALRWFYEAKADDPGENANAIGKKIVNTLERMGRVHAARAALTAQTTLQPQDDQAAHAADDPVVAQVGPREIYKSEVVRAMDDLPPDLAKHFPTPEAFLKQFVADETLYQKAQKLEYDKKPEVLAQIDRVSRQLAVQSFIAHEVVDKITLDESDLANFFSANRTRYEPELKEGQLRPSGEERVTFKQVRPQVERDYRMSKVQTAYSDLVDQEVQSGDVKLFAERMKVGKT